MVGVGEVHRALRQERDYLEREAVGPRLRIGGRQVLQLFVILQPQGETVVPAVVLTGPKSPLPGTVPY